MPGTKTVGMDDKVPQIKISSKLSTLNEIFNYKKSQKSSMNLSIEKNINEDKEDKYFRVVKRLRVKT